MDSAGVFVAANLDTEHPMELSKVCDLYVPAHASLESVYETRAARGDGAIVDMYRYDRELSSFLVRLKEYSLVDCALPEAEGCEYGGEFLIPAATRLLQAVERLDKAQYS
jgi:hypothetical protein